jgi:predicted metal-dependent hydrolase
MNPPELQDRPGRPLELDGESISVRVRESPRARTTRILVGPERPLEIIVPAGTPDPEIDGHLHARRQWISEKLARSRAVAARPAELGLDRAGVVWLEGTPVPTRRLRGGRPVAVLRDGELLIGGATGAEAAAAVRRWYRRQARTRIVAVVQVHADRLGITFASIGVREQRTRWGSCSPKRNLSFNWRLVMAPPSVLEYVVVHELCHLQVANHSKAFWRLLETALPGWREGDRWLKRHGSELRAYQPSVEVTQDSHRPIVEGAQNQ